MKNKSKQKPIVISLGGSIIKPDNINLSFLKNFKKFILKHIKKNRKFIIICGGGVLAREYIKAAKHLNKASAAAYDRVGVRATQLNAELIHSMLADHSYKEIYQNYNKKVQFKHILLASGFYPGTSTDYEAVRFARLYKAGAVYNLTNVDYVYDKNPKKHRSAKPLKALSWNQFKKIAGKTWHGGMHLPFDPVASRAAQKFRLKVFILNGKNLKNFESCLNSKKFRGTLIS